MPELPGAGSESEWSDPERLSVAWNALVRGEDLAGIALDPADFAVLERLNALARHPRPRRAFVGQLKEQIMDWSAPKALGETVALPPMRLVVNAPDRASVSRNHRWWNGPRHAFGAAATLALIVVSLIGTFLAISPPFGDGRHRATAPMLTGSTPAASPHAFVDDCPDDGTAFSDVRPVGSGFINKPDLSSDDLAATQVQLQDWAVDPGATIELPAAANGSVKGAVVDIVLEGVYVVTIDGPAVANRNSVPSGIPVQYLQAGTTVELSRGDVISYPTGRARTIRNPLSTTLLHFKSAVFYGGDAALTRPKPLPGNLHVRVDGDGMLPFSLAKYPNNEVAVALDYVELDPDAPLLDEPGTYRCVIGPVDPRAGFEGIAGYALWVGEVRA
jgi:hypothetical protein